MKTGIKNQKILTISDEELKEALKEMGTYIDISEADLENIFEIVFTHLHKKLKISHSAGVPNSPPRVSKREIGLSGFGSIVGIGLCAFLSSYIFEPVGITLLIGSFGASAVLVYAAVKSPLAQPRNLVGGHVISAVIGVACYQFFGSTIWIAAAMAVSLAIMAMLATKTLHPPGGATALIAVTGGAGVNKLGYLYVLFPVATGAVILLLVALAVNKISADRQYPEYWF
ncbi:MAG: HPP family protein [Victivallales bacterium]